MSNPSRDELRAALLASSIKEPKRATLEFFGQKIDLVQPPLSTIMKPVDPDKPPKTPLENSIDMLIDYACVPGTLERIYEEGDRKFLEGLPWGADMVRINRAVQSLTGLDLVTAEEELKNPLSLPATASPSE